MLRTSYYWQRAYNVKYKVRQISDMNRLYVSDHVLTFSTYFYTFRLISSTYTS